MKIKAVVEFEIDNKVFEDLLKEEIEGTKDLPEIDEKLTPEDFEPATEWFIGKEVGINDPGDFHGMWFGTIISAEEIEDDVDSR